MDKLYTELLSKVKEHRYTLVANTVKEENSFSISGEKARIPFLVEVRRVDTDKLAVRIVTVDEKLTNTLEFTTNIDDLTARTILRALTRGVNIIDDMYDILYGSSPVA